MEAWASRDNRLCQAHASEQRAPVDMDVDLVRVAHSLRLSADVMLVQSDTVDVEREHHCKEAD